MIDLVQQLGQILLVRILSGFEGLSGARQILSTQGDAPSNCQQYAQLKSTDYKAHFRGLACWSSLISGYTDQKTLSEGASRL